MMPGAAPPRPPPAPASLGGFGDYELLEVVARGGMGVVYRARQRSLNRIVALKMIRAGEFSSPAESQRFRFEAAAAARFDHPNLVAIYEVGDHEGQQFFSMQFMEGGVLKTRVEAGDVAREGSGSPARPSALRHGPAAAAQLVAKIARAVHYAHQRGVLHRDLKPGNILLDQQGEPHVSDFGLAKRVGGSHSLTLSGAVLGTPSYMSPEQAAGESKRITTAADVYGLGAILYELLTGQPPFSAHTPLATMRQVIEEPPRRPGRLRARVDHDLETICLKCLEKDPAQRFRSAEALAEDLERWLRREPIHARPSRPWEVAIKWARRKPALAGFLLLAAVAPALIIVLLLLHQTRLRQEQAVTHQERNKAQRMAEQTRLNLYAADIFSVHNALQRTNLELAQQVLSQYLPQADEPEIRGFEWRWLWQVAQGDPSPRLPAHGLDVIALAFSPDGRWLASAGMDGWVQLYDRRARQIAARLRAYEREPDPLARGHETFPATYTVSFSPDSQFVACCAALVTRVWRLDSLPEVHAEADLCGRWALFLGTGELAISHQWPRPTADSDNPAPANVMGLFDPQLRPTAAAWGVTNSVFCLSGDGEWLADACQQDIHLWKLRQREVVNTFCPGEQVHRLALSPDGATLALCLRGREDIELWEPQTGRQIARLLGHTLGVSAACFSPDGRLLASVSGDETVRLWDVARREELRRFRGHGLGAGCVAFSPDGRSFATGGADGMIRLWSTEAPSPPLPAITNVAPPLVFSADGRWLAAGVHADGAPPPEATAVNPPPRIAIWDLATHAAIYITSAPPVAVVFPPRAGKLLAATLPPGGATIQLWEHNPATGSSTLRLSLPTTESPVACLALRGDGEEMATGHQDGSLRWWDAQSGQLLVRSQPYTDPVEGLRYAPNGRYLLTWTSSPRLVRTWRVATRACVATNHFPGPVALALAFGPDGEACVTGGLGADARVWRTASLDRQQIIPRQRETIHLLAWSPDDRTIATGCQDGRVRLWQRATGRLLLTLLELPPSQRDLLDLAFSPDGQWFAACDDQGGLHLWHGPMPAGQNRQP